MRRAFRGLSCRLFGHQWIEERHGTRLRCVLCNLQRAGYTKEMT